MSNLACLTQLLLFFLCFWSDEISEHVYVVLGVLVIPCNHHHQTELNASCCGEQRSRSAQPRLCLHRAVGTVTRGPGSCGGGGGGGCGRGCLFWLGLHVSHINSKTTSEIHTKIKAELWDLFPSLHMFIFINNHNKWNKNKFIYDLADILKWVFALDVLF